MHVPIRVLDVHLAAHGKQIGKMVPLVESETHAEPEILNASRSLLWIRRPRGLCRHYQQLPHRAGGRLVPDLVSEGHEDRV